MTTTTKTLIAKTLNSGRAAEVRIDAEGVLTLWVDGECAGSGHAQIIPPQRRKGPLAGIKYAMAAKKAAVALTVDEYQAIQAGLDAVEEEKLDEERQGLVDDLAAAYEAVRWDREQAAGDATRMIPDYETDPAVQAAREALAAFDAAHPEVAEARERERAEAARRQINA